ncbi:MAG: chemotaxis-specific protein-glutamate methyltransferase CheB [Oligoflexia bacterium]|nr:chemotaxis-specific protein-glutamate methyltransferase CheB [Oligoflexia bacterium]
MKVLVVDDSVVYRLAISKALEGERSIEVAESVSNGQRAVDYLQSNSSIDLITLDMEMPVMDGMETIKEIRKFNKTVKIIVFSSVTMEGAQKTIDALNAGANDFVTKEEVGGAKSIDGSLGMIKDTLIPKVMALTAGDTTSAPVSNSTTPKSTASNEAIDFQIKPKMIVLGCSTGGPEALTTIFRNLKRKINVPILIVQHMPPLFTEKLAEMLNNLNDHFTCHEARAGMKVQPGHVYIAPGDYHMTLGPDMVLQTNQADKVCFVRPSVDVLFESVANNYTQQVLSIILTGMGDDGKNGVATLEKTGRCYHLIQDEASSTVWGMPGAVSRLGLGIKELPLHEFSLIIDRISSRI